MFAKSKSHGGRFAKTGGRHLTHEDAIMGMSLGNRRVDRDVMQKEKAKWQAAKKVEHAAL